MPIGDNWVIGQATTAPGVNCSRSLRRLVKGKMQIHSPGGEGCIKKKADKLLGSWHRFQFSSLGYSAIISQAAGEWIGQVTTRGLNSSAFSSVPRLMPPLYIYQCEVVNLAEKKSICPQSGCTKHLIVDQMLHTPPPPPPPHRPYRFLISSVLHFPLFSDAKVITSCISWLFFLVCKGQAPIITPQPLEMAASKDAASFSPSQMHRKVQTGGTSVPSTLKSCGRAGFIPPFSPSSDLKSYNCLSVRSAGEHSAANLSLKKHQGGLGHLFLNHVSSSWQVLESTHFVFKSSVKSSEAVMGCSPGAAVTSLRLAMIG